MHGFYRSIALLLLVVTVTLSERAYCDEELDSEEVYGKLQVIPPSEATALADEPVILEEEYNGDNGFDLNSRLQAKNSKFLGVDMNKKNN